MIDLESVDTLREKLNQAGAGKEEIIRAIGKAVVGWPYVFGAWGEECTPANRKRRKRDDHPTIVSACQVLRGDKESCAGCKWNLPVGMFDCRGFVAWLLEKAGIKIEGGGCTSQWNASSNWVLRGKIEQMPRDRICCVFTGTDSRKEHVGIYLGDGSTVECSSGVQYFAPMKSKWKYFAIPAGLYEDVPDKGQEEQTRPTLRKGSKGEWVQLLQVQLIGRGYQLPRYGADGSYGNETIEAVRAFQQDHGLAADGICGPMTWAALETSSKDDSLYTVRISGLRRTQAEKLMQEYPGAKIEEE